MNPRIHKPHHGESLQYNPMVKLCFIDVYDDDTGKQYYAVWRDEDLAPLGPGDSVLAAVRGDFDMPLVKDAGTCLMAKLTMGSMGEHSAVELDLLP